MGHSAPAVRAGGSGEGREVLRHLKQLFHLRAHDILELFEQTFNEWSNDKAPRLGASLAFYTLLSLAPLLIVLIAVATLAFGPQAARGQLVWQIQDLVGPEGAKAIQAILQASYKPAAGITAAILGFLTLLWGASAVAVELRDATPAWGLGTRHSEDRLRELSGHKDARVACIGPGLTPGGVARTVGR